MDIPSLIGSIIGFTVVIMIVATPIIVIIELIKRKIRRRKLKGFTETPPNDIENWNPEPDPIDVDPPEENPEDERLDK
jgi:hypothetical protein